MKKFLLSLATALLLMPAALRADEGMWLLPLLEKMNSDALRNLGKHHQVLTITHLHQVASRAKNQLAVSKKEIDGRTFTSVKDLDDSGRVDEIVRMLGGESETVREHAKQLLENNK